MVVPRLTVRDARIEGARLSLAVLVVTLAAACHGSIDPYGTRGGFATRLDGAKAPPEAWSVREVVARRPTEAVYVRGYLIAPRDEEARLCTRLADSGECRGGPSLIVDKSGVNLDAASALEAGCCAVGLWSPRPVVLHLKLQNRRRALILG